MIIIFKKNYHLLLICLLLLITLLIECEPDYFFYPSSKFVKINIVGYPKIPEYYIFLNNKSNLYIDGHLKKTNEFFINNTNKIIYINNKEYNFKKIKLISHGEITFKSYLGSQKFRGDFIIQNHNDNISVINIVPIDDYFASVLGSETGDMFHDEALKAQAVAIRTYYKAKQKKYKNEYFDINNADGIDMVYRGSEFATPRMYKILSETKYLYLVKTNKKLALPLFHSTSGGVILKDEVMTSGINDSINDPVLCYDIDENGKPNSIDSPYYNFNVFLNNDELTNILGNYLSSDIITDIKLKYFINTDCVDFIGFSYGNNIKWLKGYNFISLCQKNNIHSMQSIQFKISKSNNGYYFYGKGFGHLCGMSQYSAENLARNGWDYKAILNFFYPDCKLKKIK